MAQAAIYDFSGRHAIVTGGAAGIGEAIVARLLGAGARVSIWDRDLAALESAQSRLGTQVQAVQVDVSDERSVANAVNVSQAWGTRIDILVNSAGITGPNTTVIDYPVEEWDRVFAINMRGTFLTCKYVAAVMRQASGGEGYGRIVNIISTSVKQPLPNLGVSNTTRWAVAGWAKTMANELGEFGITVNNVLPGATETERLHSLVKARSEKMNLPVETIREEMLKEIPMKRFGKAEEVANAVAFLASPAAAYINGINVPVDGGRTGSL